LPRILLLGAVIISGLFFILMNLLTGEFTGLTITWFTLTAMYLGVFLLSVPASFYTRETLRALAGIPRGMWLMMISFSKIRGANSNFIHTRHGAPIKSKT
ncbi:MAG TPA: hypothetical protein VLR52_02780, partial [Bacteroidales bacterium]|nr:hypothetical protein [Bacteroidales bacterium]